MKIIIDTDPGQDDAAAIMLALGSPEIDLLGITAVAGNVPLELTARNARIVCEMSGRTDIRVFAGADKPLTRPLVTAEHVHGKTGLDGPELFEPSFPLQDGHAVDFIIEILMTEGPGTVSLCPIGPLTNIALALQKEPAIASRIQQIVLMGGGYFEQGNITPSAEFNIYVDPEAAAVVFACGAPIVMMPLDVTHKVLTTKARVDRIKAIDNRAARAMTEMLLFFERFDEEKYGTDGGPLHDPTTVAWLIKPELFSGRHCNVEIELTSDLTRGATVVDWWGVTDRAKNALVLRDVDADGFFDLLTERLANL
ncbi:MAG: nucleoside hydrolase [Alphaproteobacteria bacterium]|nr:nucleoside hydrolase [Alphaproteobacteria bacterium]MBT4083966.1 nucleoside hydrolase [Alphaproteobacteria bacterium]MBT5158695.1 nucleoside hydrolase [Alphaproteobacteria bacterium]MBT5919170.1 nucleoside hydrolase [Alphaproteobacteria bacterium]MBT6386559.1 nucleoside hydrolase [Alphaproteobacteria bacterium]